MIAIISAITFLLLSPSVNNTVSEKSVNELCFPEFDKHLIKVWIAAKDIDSKAMEAAIESAEMEWEDVQQLLSEMTIEHIDIPDFIKRVDSYVLSLSSCYGKKNYSCLKSISYHILFEFRSLRQCLFKTEYPIDNLWESIDVYFEIRNTVKDRLFNLKEWFEFEDYVNDFICKWEYYDLKHFTEIQSYYPGINKAEHSQLKEKVNSCTYNLLKSIETGYQSNFVMPCDELGDALDEILRMYSKSKSNMLM